MKKQLDPSSLSEKDRIATPAHAGDYTFRNFVAYAVYAPLYLTGPIITFNDYASQCRHRPASIESGRTARYAARFAGCLLTMELLLHYDYVGAIAKSSPRWSDWTAAHLSLLAYFNLFVIWLKLLLPWRLARLWALNDGLDPPENMVRCVSDNISTLSFWRGWHRSFYRWSLRYIYIPLGGSSFRSARDAARSVLTYGMLAGLGNLVNIFMMMAANLVGFAFGVDGLKSIVSGIFRDFNGKPPPLLQFLPFFSTDGFYKGSREARQIASATYLYVVRPLLTPVFPNPQASCSSSGGPSCSSAPPRSCARSGRPRSGGAST